MSEPGGPTDLGSAVPPPPDPAPHAPTPTPDVPPGPGLLKAVGWIVALVAAQIAFVIPVAVAPGGKNHLVLFATGTTGLFLASALIVGSKYGRGARRAFAIRFPRWKHLALVLLLTPPLLLALGEPTAWLTDALRQAGATEPLV